MPADLPREISAALGDDAGWSNAKYTLGPDGSGGVAIAPEPIGSGEEPKANYRPNEQEWLKIECENSYWIGFNKDERPGPDSLARAEQSEGKTVKLGDGNFWSIPTVHGPLSRLPKTYRFNGQKLTEEPQKKYELLCSESERWAKAVTDGGDLQITEEDWFNYAVSLLAVNYRVGPCECGLLGLLETQGSMWEEIVWASLGLHHLLEQEASKKKERTHFVT